VKERRSVGAMENVGTKMTDRLARLKTTGPDEKLSRYNGVRVLADVFNCFNGECG